jgi:prepilin-type N-terminal cleavage/methylation domain-containing protein
MARRSRGFTLLETLIAMSLVSVSMTTLVVAIGSGSKFGSLARRQATAMTVARSQAEALAHAPYGDPSIANTNTGNDGDDFADPSGAFASGALATTGANAPDYVMPSAVFIGADPAAVPKIDGEQYDVFVNVRPVLDPVNSSEMGKQIAVIVRYKIGAQWMRAVAIGYRYNPSSIGVADGLPL